MGLDEAGMRTRRQDRSLDERCRALREQYRRARENPELQLWSAIQHDAWALLHACEPSIATDTRSAIIAIATARIALPLEVGAKHWQRVVAIGWVVSAAVTALDRAVDTTPTGAELMDRVSRDLFRMAEFVECATHHTRQPAVAVIVESLTSIRLGDRTLRRSASGLRAAGPQATRHVLRAQQALLRDARTPLSFDGDSDGIGAWFESRLRQEFALGQNNGGAGTTLLNNRNTVCLEAMRLTGRSLLYVCGGIDDGVAIQFDYAALDGQTRPLARSVSLPGFDLTTVQSRISRLHAAAAARRTDQISGTEFSAHVAELLDWLGSTVWEIVVQTWPELTDMPIAVIPVGETAQLPLYPATLRGRPACCELDLTIAPSARSLILAAEHPPATGPVFVAADPSEGEDEIAFVRDEANRVAAVYGIEPTVLGRPGAQTSDRERIRTTASRPAIDDATARLLLPQLRRSAIVHLACHGRVVPDRPMESALLLGGTLQLSTVLAEDLLAGGLLVLSACDVAGIGTRAPGEQLGFPAVLLAAGARSVIAALWPLPDTPSTVRLMVDLHRRLAESPPHRALGEAIEQAVAAGAPAALWAALAHYGA